MLLFDSINHNTKVSSGQGWNGIAEYKSFTFVYYTDIIQSDSTHLIKIGKNIFKVKKLHILNQKPTLDCILFIV